MLDPEFTAELHAQLDLLPPHGRQQVLDFASALALTETHGVSGQSLLLLAGAIEAPTLAVSSLDDETDPHDEDAPPR